MKLHELIYHRQDYEKNVKQRLLEFTTFFHDYMWDGFSEDNGQFVSDADYVAIEALADKMEHMILNIGCPLSVYDMLVSISQRKIKYWASHWSEDHGKQLRTKADRVKVINNCRYIGNKTKKNQPIKNLMVDKGHFRWNRKGYTLSRKATDILAFYILTKW